jgi:hypothetical protein
MIRGGDIEGGRALLDEVGRSPMPTEELRSLRDQANVALGFTALAQDDPERAAKALERVRLQGAHSNKALLGFGWAAAAQKKPTQALVPWMELAGRDPSDAAVLEARIAVPYALAEAGAYGQALTRYQEALTAYDQENRALEESIAAIRSGKLVAGLVESNPAEDMGWYLPVTQLPDMPHQGHLAPVLAGHDRMGIYGDMLDNRRKAFAERLPQVRQRASESRLEALQRRRDGLLGEFQAAEETTDGAAYASADEQAAQAMLERAQGVLARGGDALKAELDTEATAERLRRLQGALTWQFSQQRPERRRQAEKGLHAIDGQLAEARTHDAALAGAEKEQSAQFAGFAQRLADLDKRLQTLQPRVAALATEQQTALQDTVIVALRAQQERLVGYADQARYAVAQLYDRATQRTDQRQEGERAKP